MLCANAVAAAAAAAAAGLLASGADVVALQELVQECAVVAWGLRECHFLAEDGIQVLRDLQGIK
jgi:hypothetical protein